MVKLLQYQVRLIALWSAFLLGLLFHTQLALMPLFHGVSVANSHTHEHLQLIYIFWMMLIFYAIPMFIIAVTPFLRFHRGNLIHFGITVVYSVLNILHFGLDIVVQVPSYQLALMLMLVGIGLAINWTTWRWMKGHSEGSMKRLLGEMSGGG